MTLSCVCHKKIWSDSLSQEEKKDQNLKLEEDIRSSTAAEAMFASFSMDKLSSQSVTKEEISDDFKFLNKSNEEINKLIAATKIERELMICIICINTQLASAHFLLKQ